MAAPPYSHEAVFETLPLQFQISDPYLYLTFATTWPVWENNHAHKVTFPCCIIWY